MKKILVATMAVALIIGMLGAGTFAWFSDDVSSTGNSFTSGDLVFRITSPVSDDHKIFNVTGMKPGQVVTGYFVVVNDSSAGINEKWRAAVSGSGSLGDVLDVQITLNPTGEGVPTVPAGFINAGPPNHPITSGYVWIGSLGNGNETLVWGPASGPFEKGWGAVYKLEVKMRESAGNSYENATYTGNINFHATQFENPAW